MKLPFPSAEASFKKYDVSTSSLTGSLAQKPVPVTRTTAPLATVVGETVIAGLIPGGSHPADWGIDPLEGSDGVSVGAVVGRDDVGVGWFQGGVEDGTPVVPSGEAEEPGLAIVGWGERGGCEGLTVPLGDVAGIEGAAGSVTDAVTPPGDVPGGGGVPEDPRRLVIAPGAGPNAMIPSATATRVQALIKPSLPRLLFQRPSCFSEM